ncbi:type VII toxin-antitoxin system HepT family RNase toxin [Schnuerera sp.]|uniref:type VII toxin-antitoxin system HepT family RNase toxin n=1 Tax=Schnuerera sp. TaxID=2794844 RepID=UPI002CD8C3C0|nr:DUF86 domain-containing protein [Schnuerera sp.]HSH34770.1 DUF86 domain-containing protein [Schnuerera sp.]
MVRREIVLSRISKLDEYIEFLYEMGKYPKEEYLFDPMIYGSTERFLHLSIECVIDIANHIISDMGYRKPSSNKEIFEILFENKIIDNNLKENLSNMAGFRNILVHDYINLDREVVYDILNNNLKDIEDFRDIALEYV